MPFTKIPVLASYAYLKPPIIEMLGIKEVYDNFDIIIDSGAFTAFKTGRQIDIDDYIHFIETAKFPIQRYFTLDSIGNPEITRKNYDLIVREGLTPIPVFTRGETKKDFDYYHDSRGLVGIGGIAGTNGSRDYLINLYDSKIITADKKVHWLGFTIHDFLLHYKPFSCDTASWATGCQYARGWYYANRKYHAFTKDNYKQAGLKSFCEKYGLDSTRLGKEESWKRKDNVQPYSQVIQLYAAWDYLYTMKKKLDITIYLSISDFTMTTTVKTMLENIQNFRRNCDN